MKERNEGRIIFFENFAMLSFSGFERKRSLVLLQAWLRQACKNSLYMLRRRFLQKNFLESLLLFPHFRKSSKNFSEFWRENFGRVVTNTLIHVPRNTFRKVIFLSKSSKFFFVVFGIWAANVWTLRENYLLPLSRLHSLLLKNHFWWKKQIRSKNCNFNYFGVPESFPFFWQQSYGRLAKISLCMFRRTFWGEIILFGKRTSFSSFSEFEQKVLRVLTANFWRGGHKWILHVQKHHLRKNIFPSRKLIISLFLSWNLSDKSVVFWRKIFGRVVKIALSVVRESFLMKKNSDQKFVTPSFLDYRKLFRVFGDKVTAVLSNFLCTCSDEHFEEKHLFWKVFFSSFPAFEQKVFRVLTRNFWQGCHNCILHLHRNILRSFFINSKNSWFFRRFRNLRFKLWIFREKILLALSKLHSTLLKNHFWRKKNLLKKL